LNVTPPSVRVNLYSVSYFMLPALMLEGLWL
jgi:hypothetical protein